MKVGTLETIISINIPSICDHINKLKEKYCGCCYNSLSEIHEVDQLPLDMQTDIMDLSSRYAITLSQAKQCYMVAGRSEQTSNFCEILRDKGEYVYQVARAVYLGDQFKKQSQELKQLFCNNYRKMHGLPLKRRKK